MSEALVGNKGHSGGSSQDWIVQSNTKRFCTAGSSAQQAKEVLGQGKCQCAASVSGQHFGQRQNGIAVPLGWNETRVHEC